MYVKLLIPTYEPGGIDAKIYPHWKDSPTFTQVILSKEGNVVDIKVHKLLSDELIINLVVREGINYVIAQSLSSRAIELLCKVGVKVLTGKVNTVKEALEKFRRRELYLLKLIKEPMK